MASTSLVAARQEIESIRNRAAMHRKASAEDTRELLTTAGCGLVGTAVGALERHNKMPETFQMLGMTVPTKAALAIGAQTVALLSKGQTRRTATAGARALLTLAGYEIGRHGGLPTG